MFGVLHRLDLCLTSHPNDFGVFLQSTECEQAVVYLVQALCDLNCPEAVLGVHSWCRLYAGKKFPWVKAAAEKASKRCVLCNVFFSTFDIQGTSIPIPSCD